MTKQVSLVVTLLLSLATTATASPIEWKAADGGNGHFYELVKPTASTTWHEARDASIGLGGYLVSITSAAEDQFIIDNFMEPDRTVANRVWLGGYDPTGLASQVPFGEWVWLTGEAFLYENWQQTSTGFGQPTGSEYFIEYTWEPAIDSFGWNDIEAIGLQTFQPYGFVVEYNQDPNVSIPEPSTFVLAALGLLGLGITRRRRRR